MAWSTDTIDTVYVHHRIKCSATGARTMVPNRSETAVWLFKNRFYKLADGLGKKATIEDAHGCASMSGVCVGKQQPTNDKG